MNLYDCLILFDACVFVVCAALRAAKWRKMEHPAEVLFNRAAKWTGQISAQRELRLQRGGSEV
jgi:hypothetical protein